MKEVFQMKPFKIFVFKIRRNLLPGIFLLFLICLILFSSSNMQAAKSGLKLWANSVIPSLFPFFIATEVLSKTRIPYQFGRIFNKLMKPLFNISGEGSFALFMGWLSRLSCSEQKLLLILEIIIFVRKKNVKDC